MTAALESALDDWAAMADSVSNDREDPADYFATGFRMTGRLQRANPELVRVLLRSGATVLTRERGLRARGLDGLHRGMKAGRFAQMDPDIAIMLVGGALLGLLQLLDDNPDHDGDAFADAAAERVLVMLGIDAAEAAQIARTPLPPLPELMPGT